jgi:hypothetical protein
MAVRLPPRKPSSSAASAVWERPPGGFIRFTWKRLSYGTARRSPSGRPNRSTNAAFRSTTTAWTKRMCSCAFSTTKSAFDRSDVETRSQIDYIKDLTLVPWWASSASARWWGSANTCCSWKAIRPRWPFPSPRNTRAKGLGKLFIRKLARAARENGISGLVAYTSPQNKAMIALFKTLPFLTRYKEQLWQRK